jgi:hypothetical protein
MISDKMTPRQRNDPMNPLDPKVPPRPAGSGTMATVQNQLATGVDSAQNFFGSFFNNKKKPGVMENVPPFFTHPRLATTHSQGIWYLV